MIDSTTKLPVWLLMQIEKELAVITSSFLDKIDAVSLPDKYDIFSSRIDLTIRVMLSALITRIVNRSTAITELSNAQNGYLFFNEYKKEVLRAFEFYMGLPSCKLSVYQKKHLSEEIEEAPMWRD